MDKAGEESKQRREQIDCRFWMRESPDAEKTGKRLKGGTGTTRPTSPPSYLGKGAGRGTKIYRAVLKRFRKKEISKENGRRGQGME